MPPFLQLVTSAVYLPNWKSLTPETILTAMALFASSNAVWSSWFQANYFLKTEDEGHLLNKPKLLDGASNPPSLEVCDVFALNLLFPGEEDPLGSDVHHMHFGPLDGCYDIGHLFKVQQLLV